MDHDKYVTVKTLEQLYGFTEQATEDLIDKYNKQSEVKDLYEFIRVKSQIGLTL